MLHPQLDTFLQVVESGSFSRAALRRNCSTVSIMNQINNFEGRLGLKLLERSSQGVSLTEVGKIFYLEVKKLKNTANNILTCARELASSGVSIIRIGNSYLRPCKPLLDLMQSCQSVWDKAFQISIVPFDDNPRGFTHFRDRLDNDVDCFVSPYDGTSWINNYAIYHLGYYKCCISMPIGHRLARKDKLTWDDLTGETIMLVASGISPIIDQIRNEIGERHDINIVDSPSYYDMETFNRCQREGFLVETPEIWGSIHPGFVTLPMAWPYRLPFGLIYSRRPSLALERFINMLETCAQARQLISSDK